jgi:hypothetical protein
MNGTCSRCLRVGYIAMVGGIVGCNTGGPDAFAPGGNPSNTPAVAGASEPVVAEGAGAQAPRRSKKGTIASEGPRERP